MGLWGSVLSARQEATGLFPPVCARARACVCVVSGCMPDLLHSRQGEPEG